MFMLFQTTETWISNQTIALIIVALITNLATYFIGKGKSKAEISKNTSEARRVDAETVILSGDKLIAYIEKFEVAKSEAMALEDDIAKVKRELRDCVDQRGDCSQFLTQLKVTLDSIFSKLELALTDFAHKDEMMEDLSRLRDVINSRLNATSVSVITINGTTTPRT